jgi:hypothetical protein
LKHIFIETSIYELDLHPNGEEERMTENTGAKKKMGILERIPGVFISPRETFESVKEKSVWWIPFLITVVLALVLLFMAYDISVKDQLAGMRAADPPATEEQIQQAEVGMRGIGKYIAIGSIPIATLAVWAILSGCFLLMGNSVLGGDSTFKQIFSMTAWSSLIGSLAGIVKSLLILSKGTSRGVTTSLSILLPTPELGQKAPILHRLLSKFDIFTIWQIVVWIIGLAVIYRFESKKSALIVLPLWGLWIVVSLILGGLFGGRMIAG